jgi:disulfide bond formation protein DsbB
MRVAIVRAVLILGGAYFIVGVLFGALAGQAESNQGRVAWRWAAWALSAAVFGAHIVYEQVRVRSSPGVTALHVSSAAALGAFGLAIAANVHAQTAGAREHSLALALSLAIWPVMTALPAFVVALVAAVLFDRTRRGT